MKIPEEVPLVESDALAPSEAPLREGQYFNNYQDSTSDITKITLYRKY